MAYCQQCGVQVDPNEKFCPNCGTKLPQPGETSGEAPAERTVSRSDDVNENRGVATLSYIGPLCFVPYFAAKRSPFAHYHAIRGLNLFILEGVYSVIEILLTSIFRGVFGAILAILLGLGWAFFIYLSVMGIINVSKGKKKNLPFIADFRVIKK